MRLTWFTCSLFLYLAAATPAISVETQPATLSDLSRQLSSNSKLCANFAQKKIMMALNRPLLSKGRLIFLAGQGILWQVTEPFPAKVLVKETEMIKWDEDGVPKRLGYGQSPLFHALIQVFLSMFTGDMSKLERVFAAVPIQTGEGWWLTLTPRDPGLAKIISTIEVGGGRFVEHLQIVEVRGDKTAIQFSNIDVDTCELGNAEKASFAY